MKKIQQIFLTNKIINQLFCSAGEKLYHKILKLNRKFNLIQMCMYWLEQINFNLERFN